MKQIVLIIVSLMATACIPEGMYNSKTKDGIRAYHFVYNEHSYIRFSNGQNIASYDDYVGYVHDPDCPCHEKEEGK